eukprot:TRINITY_DN76919_c0_g1_i1.p1 TRINITY_DN76919_c0_g1~~TRINITY_DN76919_c0_g1_i1.p1  ORF type:complete len:484 (-),score=92.46 TRINITY_DN76919_c0_g1_i1:4-1455(-)
MAMAGALPVQTGFPWRLVSSGDLLTQVPATGPRGRVKVVAHGRRSASGSSTALAGAGGKKGAAAVVAAGLMTAAALRQHRRRCGRAQACTRRCRLAAAGQDAGPPKRVLVVGGSGRVGGSTSRWVQKLAADHEDLQNLQLSLGGRSERRFRESLPRWQMLAGEGAAEPGFVQLDHEDRASVSAALARGWDLVIHTAGPFQGVEKPVILEEAIKAKVPYVDVCDDTDLCRTAKELSEQAQRGGVPALVSTGIWPGASALLVAKAVEDLGGPEMIENVEMSFFTAGTGGAGPTIVSATFLLLAEPPLIYKAGAEARAEPWTDSRVVDFGPGVGERTVYLLDEPECYTVGKVLGLPNISSRFSTAPDVWNGLFGAVKIFPESVLRDRALMQLVANFSMPIINAVDQLVGSTNSMRVDVISKDGRTKTVRVTHPDLEQCVGLGTAAFALEVLLGRVPDGVWYPAEVDRSSRSDILQRVSCDATLWEL